MTKHLLTSLLLLLGLAAASCHGGGGLDIGASDTKIIIRQDSPTGAIISQPDARGAITMNVGDTRTIRIMRLETDSGTGVTTPRDVTADADFNFTNVNVASADANGMLSALASGFTQLNVKFRDDDADPTETDEVDLDITVLP